MNFDNKVLLITGAGTGIGKDVAITFAKKGGKVALAGRRIGPLEETAEEIKSLGSKAVIMSCDVSKPEEVKDFVELTVKEYGQLDYAFNNAGIEGKENPLHEQDIEFADYVFKVNLNGMFYSMKYEIEQMLKNGGGSIVNHSSICGLRGIGNAIYCSTKHGIIGLTKSAALNYAKLNIRVNAIAPGPIRTPLHSRNTNGDPDSAKKMVPMDRIGEPVEVTECVLWLLSDAASYVTGHTLPIDGGMNAQ